MRNAKEISKNIEAKSEKGNGDFSEGTHFCVLHQYSYTPFQMKDIIDFLLSETDYTKEHIASTPRILFFSLDTIRERVEQLKTVGGPFPHLSELTQAKIRFRKLIHEKHRKCT